MAASAEMNLVDLRMRFSPASPDIREDVRTTPRSVRVVAIGAGAARLRTRSVFASSFTARFVEHVIVATRNVAGVLPLLLALRPGLALYIVLSRRARSEERRVGKEC